MSPRQTPQKGRRKNRMPSYTVLRKNKGIMTYKACPFRIGYCFLRSREKSHGWCLAMGKDWPFPVPFGRMLYYLPHSGDLWQVCSLQLLPGPAFMFCLDASLTQCQVSKAYNPFREFPTLDGTRYNRAFPVLLGLCLYKGSWVESMRQALQLGDQVPQVGSQNPGEQNEWRTAPQHIWPVKFYGHKLVSV